MRFAETVMPDLYHWSGNDTRAAFVGGFTLRISGRPLERVILRSPPLKAILDIHRYTDNTKAGSA